MSAIATSKPVPSLRSAAGARLTVITWPGHCEARRVHAAANAVLRLLAGAVGQPDDRERRLLTRAQVRLDLDTARLEADERERDRATEHAFDRTARRCHATVPPSCRVDAHGWWDSARPHHPSASYAV